MSAKRNPLGKYEVTFLLVKYQNGLGFTAQVHVNAVARGPAEALSAASKVEEIKGAVEITSVRITRSGWTPSEKWITL